MQGTIIVVDDNKGVLSAVKLLLKNSFERIITLTSPITLPAVLREENAQVVLLDMNFSSGLNIWGIERSGFFNGREKWAKGFENQRV